MARAERVIPTRSPIKVNEADEAVWDKVVDVADHRSGGMRMNIYGRNGCLSGDTQVRYTIMDGDKPQNANGGTLERLFMRFNGIPRPGRGSYQRPQTLGSSYHIQSVTDDGRVFNNLIEGVTESGYKEVFLVTTKGGRFVKATADHPFLTENGYVPLCDLSIRTNLMVNPRVRRSKGGVKRRVYRKELCVLNHGNKKRKVVNDCVYYRVKLTYAVYEADQNGMSLPDYVSFLNKRSKEEVHALWRVPERMEIHHLDGNPKNDTLSNLVLTSSSGEHQRVFHHDEIRDRFGIYAESDPVESIERVGKEDTYDIQVKGPHHNFDVNGIIVHNSGKTTVACTFPKDLLLIGFEDGTKSVTNVPGVKYFDVGSIAEVEAIVRGLKGRMSGKFQTVVIDTATSLQDLALKELMGLEELPVQFSWGTVSRDQYRQRAERAKEVMRLFFDAHKSLHFEHLVVLAQEKDHTPRSGEDGGPAAYETDVITPFIGSNLGGSTCSWLQDNVDHICQMYTRDEMKTREVKQKTKDGEKTVMLSSKTGKTEHCLRFARSHPVYAAKIRADTELALPDVIVSPTFEKMARELKLYQVQTGK